MAKRRRRRSRNSRRRRIRNAIRITLFFLIVVAIIGGIILLVSKLINKGGETGDIGSDAAIEQPAGQEEEKQGFFARLFKKKDKEQDGLFDEEGNPLATQPPEPTPTPLPEFSPYSVAGTSPSDFGLETKIEVDGSEMDASQYTAADVIDFEEGYKYTQLEGVITFRGNNFRDSPSYGTASMTEKKFDTSPWTFTVGSMQKMYGSGSWSGCGWTGQPLLVRWPAETKRIMNMRDWAKQKDGLPLQGRGRAGSEGLSPHVCRLRRRQPDRGQGYLPRLHNKPHRRLGAL